MDRLAIVHAVVSSKVDGAIARDGLRDGLGCGILESLRLRILDGLSCGGGVAGSLQNLQPVAGVVVRRSVG